MRSQRRISVLALLSLLIGTQALAGSPQLQKGTSAILPAWDLHDDARRDSTQRAIFLILFSLPRCSFCEEVRTNYLTPLQGDEAHGARLFIRQVELNGERTLTDFDGTRITERDLAARHGVRFAPTLAFLGSRGQSLAPPLIGSGKAGFYGAYLEAALTSALANIGHD